MNAYPSAYPTGYGGQYQYPSAVLPPNQFYVPPPPPQQYNGYPAAHYQSRFRRPSDPGPQPQEYNRALIRRNHLARQAEPEPPKISRPIKQRKNSMRAGITPDFIFISLSSHDVLKIGNLTSPTLLDYLREALPPWWPQGIVSEDERDNEWTVRLGGEVWAAGGHHGLMARRLIRQLFTILAEEGFGYLATVDSHPMKAPRMVFTSVPPEIQPRYFMISFSLNRRTLTVIDAPEKLTLLVAAALRPTEALVRHNEAATTPRVIPSDGWIEPGVYQIETSVRGTGRRDVAELMGSVLKLISAEGWRFEASVPFGKAGLFGLRGRREVWMFRRIPTPRPAKLPRTDPRR